VENTNLIGCNGFFIEVAEVERGSRGEQRGKRGKRMKRGGKR
jgi:hypothetical protein